MLPSVTSLRLSMEWKLSLAQATNLPAKTFSTMSNGEVVKKLFEGCIFPGIEVAMDGVTLDISDKFNINKVCNILILFIINNIFLRRFTAA